MKKLILGVIPALMLSACGESGTDDVLHQAGIEEYTTAMVATEGNEATGMVTFRRTGDGIAVTAHIEGLQPNQQHGFHIHQYGDCSAPDGTSAGGHFNPESTRHGGRDDDERHVGDLGNLESNENGEAQVEFIDDRLQMDGPHSILGRGVIVHAQADDLESQPTGDAGGRLSCGVIGVAD